MIELGMIFLWFIAADGALLWAGAPPDAASLIAALVTAAAAILAAGTGFLGSPERSQDSAH